MHFVGARSQTEAPSFYASLFAIESPFVTAMRDFSLPDLSLLVFSLPDLSFPFSVNQR